MQTAATITVPCASDPPPPPKRARIANGSAEGGGAADDGPEHYARLLNVYEVDMGMHATNRARLAARFRGERDFGAAEASRAPAGAACPPGSLLLFQGGETAYRDATDHEPVFRQESNFHWAFGVREPDCYGIVEPDTGRGVLFVPRLPQEYSVFMGAVHTREYFRKYYGVDEVKYSDELAAYVSGSSAPRVYLVQGLNTDSGATAKPAAFPEMDAALAAARGGEGCETDLRRLWDEVVELRVFKTEAELDLMRHVSDVSSDAHIAVMRRAAPAMREFQLESLFRHWTYFTAGCRHQSYASICGCGPNSAVLHYGHAGAPNEAALQDGDMCLLDMGAEYHCYASDITCSFPANGSFTADQRAIFEAVRDAAWVVMDAMKPGVHWNDMHALANRSQLASLSKMGLLSGDLDAMMAANLGAIFMPHGLGHLMGIDTHDVGGIPAEVQEKGRDTRLGWKSLRCVRPLAEGMVITVEPGIYFNDWLLDSALADPKLGPFMNAEALARFRGSGGIRLEDDVLVTETGIENLTCCPRTVEDVMDVMAGTISHRSQLKTKKYYRAQQ